MSMCRWRNSIFSLWLLWGAPSFAREWYVASAGGLDSPDGGTRAAPVATILFALKNAARGDSVVVGSGRHKEFSYSCTPAQTGIVLRAEHERRSFVPWLNLYDCSGWSIEGFTFDGNPSADNPLVGLGSFGSPPTSSDAIFRRNLLVGRSTFAQLRFNARVGALVEENEFRALSETALYAGGAGLTVRRNHFVASVANDTVVSARTRGAVYENNVFECTGARTTAVSFAESSRFIGNLVRSDYGLLAKEFSDLTVADNFLLSNDYAMYLRHVGGATLTRNTILADLRIDDFPNDGGPFQSAAIHFNFIRANIVFGGLARNSLADSNWVLSDGGVPANRLGGQRLSHQDIDLESCWAYPPPSSPLRNSDGGLLGAQILYRSVNGKQTDELLWDAESRFPCGAVVVGLNDSFPRCDEIHKRFGVNRPACPLPVKLRFTSVPAPLATCGSPYRYQPTLSDPSATLTLTSSSSATLNNGVLEWNAGRAGERASFQLVARTPSDSATQRFEVNVDCTPSCSVTPSGVRVILLLMLACPRRLRRRAP